ncbi:MAG: hypothetical protein IKF39_01690 [Oscillospiraceae bacterium]|nr:hypothetical protein [Oscillospiraceae bacterium]
MPTPRKLKSGNWTIQLHITDSLGKVHRPSYTAPTKAEVLDWASQFQKSHEKKVFLTVREAVRRYIDLSRDTLSPTTIEAYEKYIRYSFVSIMDRDALSLTSSDMQIAINEETHRLYRGKPLSAKTVKNEWGLIAASLKAICDRHYNIKLPKTQERPLELPEPEAILRAIKGTEVELPCLLSMWLSFSMSEVRGIKCSSIRNGKVYIERTVVEVHGESIEKKNAKTATRIRSAVVPDYIMGLIEQTDAWKEWEQGKDGFLIPHKRFWIYDNWTKVCRENGFTLSFHGLRHMNASILLNVLNAPSKTVQEKGGWRTNRVMDRTYSHSFTSVRKKVDREMDDYMTSLINS